MFLALLGWMGMLLLYACIECNRGTPLVKVTAGTGCGHALHGGLPVAAAHRLQQSRTPRTLGPLAASNNLKKKIIFIAVS